MKRQSGWDARLADYIHGRIRTEFVWGENDCALFAADAVLAMTGVDLASDLRGRYHSGKTAAQVIKDYAGNDLLALVEKKSAEFGFPEVAIPFASRGDLVLIPQESGGDALGIMGMDCTHAIGVGATGLRKIARAEILKAWKIG